MANDKYVSDLLKMAGEYVSNANFEATTRELIAGLVEVIQHLKIEEAESSKKMADNRLKARKYDELAATHRASSKSHEALVGKIRGEVVPKIQSVSQLLTQLEKDLAAKLGEGGAQPQVTQIRSSLRDILICFTAGEV